MKASFFSCKMLFPISPKVGSGPSGMQNFARASLRQPVLRSLRAWQRRRRPWHQCERLRFSCAASAGSVDQAWDATAQAKASQLRAGLPAFCPSHHWPFAPQPDVERTMTCSAAFLLVANLRRPVPQASVDKEARERFTCPMTWETQE